jgi:DNA polymerase-3 subunit delta'
MIRFRDILGQEAALDVLRRAWRAERLPHGLLFIGPAGVGKATTAAALGALFLCERPTDGEPCGVCQSCKLFASGAHPDYHVIVKELIRYHDKTGKSKGINLSIDVLRPELVDPANRKAVMGRGKVFVVEQAELMTAQAQNAILKTLEEPAGRTLIVLLSDTLHALLPTIRSRCQMIRFASLSRELVSEQLAQRGIGAADAATAAQLADGSLGTAMKWLADGVIERAGQLGQMIRSLREGRGVEELPDWFKKSAEAYAEKQLARDELASKDQATKEGLGLYLMLAASHFREQLAKEDDAQALESLCAAIDAIARAEMYLDGNVNVALVFQQLKLALETELSPHGALSSRQ